jgi:type VI secretion system protein ImpL
MDRFYKDRLLDYTLRDDQGQIVPDVNTPIGARLSKKTLNYFAMAQRIQQAFFEPGSKQPSVTFTIRQETSSDGVEGSLLTMGSRQLNLIANSSASEIRWPDEVPEIILTLLPQVSGGRNSRRFEGRWAMMDFIKTGSSGRPNGTQLTLTHRVGPRSARFRMEFFSTAVPFLMRELDDFRCPTTLQ